MERSQQSNTASGLAYGIAAYGLWGLMPLYFRAIDGVLPLELLAHRIVWSGVLLAGLLSVLRRWPDFMNCLANPRTRWLLLASALLLALNWLVFIHGVATRQIVQNSLGYFINPLLNVLLGVFFFHERPRAGQWIALVLAAGAMVFLIASLGTLPWIAFTLATSFAVYGLIRKAAPVDALVGVTIESVYLMPISVAYLAWWLNQPNSSLGRVSWQLDVLILASGAVTAIPLLCFGKAARLLPLSTLGFLQYLAPSMQFLLAVLLFDEPFGQEQQISFGLIWLALALATADALMARGQEKRYRRVETQQ